jgi:hypothetical protein
MWILCRSTRRSISPISAHVDSLEQEVIGDGLVRESEPSSEPAASKRRESKGSVDARNGDNLGFGQAEGRTSSWSQMDEEGEEGEEGGSRWPRRTFLLHRPPCPSSNSQPHVTRQSGLDPLVFYI